ncbi:MAG: prepilin-type N-terminal cleavage/methylation domain-containing protein [Deltaproteobacteria bacterium]|nr:prepilin-type N-terminal cleavage/methylation domain-containing protein [Deltaproteobacteria bacterium]
MATRRRGMTLMEVLIALLIVSVVIAGTAASVTGVFSSRLVQSTGKLMAMVRYTYDRAVMTGKRCQLVIDLEGGGYWIEELEEEASCEARIQEAEAGEPGERPRGGRDGEAPVEETGAKMEDMVVKAQELPAGVRFSGVMAQHHQEPVTSGEARILFQPDGTAEQALVWISREEQVYTVEIRALQGRGVLHREELSPTELRRR